MADKFSYQLNMGERLTLLDTLPEIRDYTTYKILTKLKMALAPDEQELAKYKFETLYRCVHKTYDDNGVATQCEWETYADDTPKCPIHNEHTASKGLMRWTPEMATNVKTIWMGRKAKSLIIETLGTRMADTEKAKSDMDITLYEKFVIAEEKEKEED